MHQLNLDIARLQKQKNALRQNKEDLIRKQEKLELEIAAQDDPRWIEQVLIRKVGVVPKGQTKVLFKK